MEPTQMSSLALALSAVASAASIFSLVTTLRRGRQSLSLMDKMLKRAAGERDDSTAEKRAAFDAYIAALRSEPVASLLTTESRESASKANIVFDAKALSDLTGVEVFDTPRLRTHQAAVAACLALTAAGRLPFQSQTWKTVIDFIQNYTGLRVNNEIVSASMWMGREFRALSVWSDEDKDGRVLDANAVLASYPEVDCQHGTGDMRTFHSLVKAMVAKGALSANHPAVLASDAHATGKKKPY